MVKYDYSIWWAWSDVIILSGRCGQTGNVLESGCDMEDGSTRLHVERGIPLDHTNRFRGWSCNVGEGGVVVWERVEL